MVNAAIKRTLDYIYKVETDWFEDTTTSVPWTDKTYTKEMYKRIVVRFDVVEYRQTKLNQLV